MAKNRRSRRWPYAPVAQWIEHQIPVLGVGGSSPSRRTKVFVFRTIPPGLPGYERKKTPFTESFLVYTWFMDEKDVPVIAVQLPQYQVDTEPDHTAIGKIVDAEIKKAFIGQVVVVRGIGSQEHSGKSIDELIDAIKRGGIDRYDPTRKGDRYENVENKHIDLFGFRRKVTPRLQLFKDVSWGFYHGAIAIHGKPTRIDMLIIYDASKLKAVVHQYEGRTDAKRDGFVFKDSVHKPEALLGIIKVLA